MPGLMARRMADMGRGGDTEVAHLTPGEVVVPGSVLQQPGVRRGLMSSFNRAGRDFGRFEVGGMDDSRNPVTGMREYFDPGDMESGQDPGVGGDFGGMDGGPADTGFDFDQAQAAQDAASMADFGRDMDTGPVSAGFNPDQYEQAQAWGDYNKGYNVAKHMPFGLGLFAKAINYGVQKGVLPEPMTRSELSADRADWAARGPMVGGTQQDPLQIAETTPRNGMAPSRGFHTPGSAGTGAYTPPASSEPTYLKYLKQVEVA